MLLRAYAYIRTLGPEGIREAARPPRLNANYIRANFKDTFPLPFPGPTPPDENSEKEAERQQQQQQQKQPGLGLEYDL